MKKWTLFLLMLLLQFSIVSASETLIADFSGTYTTQGSSGSPVPIGNVTLKKGFHRITLADASSTTSARWLRLFIDGYSQEKLISSGETAKQRYDVSKDKVTIALAVWGHSYDTGFSGSVTIKIHRLECPDVDGECIMVGCPNCGETYCFAHRSMFPHNCPCPYSIECLDVAICECCDERVCQTHDNWPCGCEFDICPSCALANSWNKSHGHEEWMVDGKRSCVKHREAVAADLCIKCGVYGWCRYHGGSDHSPCNQRCPYTDSCSKPLSKCSDCQAQYCTVHNTHRRSCTGCGSPNICPNKHACPECPTIPGICKLVACSGCSENYCSAHQAGEHAKCKKTDTAVTGKCPDAADCSKKTCDKCKKTFCSTHQIHSCSKDKDNSGGIGGGSGSSVTLSCPNKSDCSVISCPDCRQLYCATHVTHTCPTGGGTVRVCPNQDDCGIMVCSECDTSYCETHTPHVTHSCPNLKECIKLTCDKCWTVYCAMHDEHSCPDCPYMARCVRTVCAKCGETYCTASHASAHVCGSGGGSGGSNGGDSGGGNGGSNGSGGGSNGGSGNIGGGQLDLTGNSNATTGVVNNQTDNSAVGLSVGAAGLAFGLGNSRPGQIFGPYDIVNQERLDALRKDPSIRNWTRYEIDKAKANGAPENSRHYTKDGVNYVRER